MKKIYCISGGKTSAFMSSLAKDEKDAVHIFANTGQELNETLDFLNKVDKHFKLNIVWLEAVINPERNKGTGYKVVTYETATRIGDSNQPFEDMCKKYGIPNNAYKHCTRELKEAPVNAWIKDNIKGDYVKCIGIRSDEPKRIKDNKLNIYPLNDLGIDKQHVNDFWLSMPFTLNIREHEGNCLWCFKKSKRKLYMLANSDKRKYFDFPSMLEEKYGFIGNNKIMGVNRPNIPRTLYRGYVDTGLLLAQADQNDPSRQPSLFDNDESSCSDECRPFAD